MKRLFPVEAFAGFGPSRIHPAGFSPIRQEVCGSRPSVLRGGVRESAPRLPGVYGMLDRRGRLIYVGKAKLLRARLMSYFRTASRDPKAGRIISNTAVIIWESATDEFAALIRELELIQRFMPRYNVQGQPGSRRYIYLCLGRSPGAHVFATREPTGKELAIYGPLVGASRVREAARRLNDAFRLRDCPKSVAMRFADQGDLFESDLAPGCIRFEIGTCLGPCAALCSQREYAVNSRAARTFLDGSDRKLLVELEADMLDASGNLEYEKAMAIRDRLSDLRWLTDRLVWLKNARQDHSFIYPLTGADEKTVWYLIERGQVRAAVYPKARGTSKLIEQTYRAPACSDTIMPRGQVDSVLLVAAWFRKRPDERAKCFKPNGSQSSG